VSVLYVCESVLYVCESVLYVCESVLYVCVSALHVCESVLHVCCTCGASIAHRVGQRVSSISARACLCVRASAKMPWTRWTRCTCLCVRV